MRWPLRYQILIPMVSIMVCAIVAVTLLHAWLATNQIKLQIRDQFRQIAYTLNEATFPLTDAVLNQTKGLSGADFVLVDQNDVVLSSTRPDFVPAAVNQNPPDWKPGMPVFFMQSSRFSSGRGRMLYDIYTFTTRSKRIGKHCRMPFTLLYWQAVLR